MVQLTRVHNGVMRTFGLRMRGKMYNHRVPIKYQKFKIGLDPEKIVAHYSRDDIDSLDRRAGQRTYKDAQNSMERKATLLSGLRKEDLDANRVFQEEQNRQRAMIARIEKIRVIVDSDVGRGTELVMNKNMSTPYDCARHINELLLSRTVVAELSPIESEIQPAQSLESQESNDISSDTSPSAAANKLPPKSVLWDMHRPLENDTRIKFRHFVEDDVHQVNKVFWRSCSFVLGMAIRMSFKDGVKVLLHSWPKPNIKSGSFVYDVALNLKERWNPTEQELRAMTKVLWNIKSAELPIERLDVKREVAMEMFARNPFKLTQIDSILQDSHDKLTVYRCGGLLDLSIGPLISNTSQIGRISVAAVHPYDSDSSDLKGVFYRFQGTSLPQQLPVSSYLYQHILLEKAKEFNKTSLS